MVNSLARFGYLLLLVLCLQAVSLVAIAFLQYGIFNYIQPAGSDAGVIEVLDTALLRYGEQYTSAPPPRPGIVLTIILWSIVVAIIALLAIYIGKYSSAALRGILKHWRIKVTVGSLFAAKFITAGTVFLIISASALLLPAVYIILDLNTVIALTCFVSFALQLYLVRLHKTPIKNIL